MVWDILKLSIPYTGKTIKVYLATEMIGHSDNQPILWIVDTIEIQKVLDFSFIQRYFPSRNQENPRKEIRFTFFSKVLNHALGTFQKSASSNFYCVLKKTKQSCKNFWGNWDTRYFWLVTVLKYIHCVQGELTLF